MEARKTKMLQVRLEADEYRGIELKAKNEGLSVSEWVRKKLLERGTERQ
jgi:predicted HicB family RNase H-like nuclease